MCGDIRPGSDHEVVLLCPACGRDRDATVDAVGLVVNVDGVVDHSDKVIRQDVNFAVHLDDGLGAGDLDWTGRDDHRGMRVSRRRRRGRC